MEITRRQLIAASGGTLAFAGIGKAALAQSGMTLTEEQRTTRIETVNSNRTSIRNANSDAGGSKYKLRLINNFRWNLVFGLFGMVQPMEWRMDLAGNGGQYQSSRREIKGGERVAVIWDDFSESVLDYQLAFVNHNLVIEVDNNGFMLIT